MALGQFGLDLVEPAGIDPQPAGDAEPGGARDRLCGGPAAAPGVVGIGGPGDRAVLQQVEGVADAAAGVAAGARAADRIVDEGRAGNPVGAQAPAAAGRAVIVGAGGKADRPADAGALSALVARGRKAAAQIDPFGQKRPESPGLRPFRQRRRIFRQGAGGVDRVFGVRPLLSPHASVRGGQGDHSHQHESGRRKSGKRKQRHGGFAPILSDIACRSNGFPTAGICPSAFPERGRTARRCRPSPSIVVLQDFLRLGVALRYRPFELDPAPTSICLGSLSAMQHQSNGIPGRTIAITC